MTKKLSNAYETVLLVASSGLPFPQAVAQVGRRLNLSSKEEWALLDRFNAACEKPAKKRLAKKSLPVEKAHVSDADCKVNPETQCCRVCDIGHGAPCYSCGQRAYHTLSCERTDTFELPTLNLRHYFASHRLFTKASPKTLKGEAYGYSTLILYLKPWKWGGYGNLCPMASAGCIGGCLNTSGHGVFASTQEARQRRTDYFFRFRELFIAQIVNEVANHCRLALAQGLIPVVRLNGTSDFPWENYRSQLFDAFPTLIFYDYTKIVRRVEKSLTDPAWPANYTLAYSLSEKPESESEARRVLALGGRVAAVYSHASPLPDSDLGAPVVDGDKNDLIFLHPKGSVMGLKAKGKAKKDTSGFVRSCPSLTLPLAA